MDKAMERLTAEELRDAMWKPGDGRGWTLQGGIEHSEDVAALGPKLCAAVIELARLVGGPIDPKPGCQPCGCRRVRTSPMPHGGDCIVPWARELLEATDAD